MNFPNRKTETIKYNNKANLGMALEQMINETNEYYLNNDIAVIHKKPTPVQIVKVSYPMRSKAVITEAYYKTPSTTDYNGIYKGMYIDFEAKENHNKTLFPLRNIHDHQIKHLESIKRHGGIAFLIISFNHYNETYLVPLEIVLKYYHQIDTTRKSIPYDEFKNNCFLIKESYLPRLDYLKVLEENIDQFKKTI